MSKGASGWVKRFRARTAAWQARPMAATAGTRLSYWEAKGAGAFADQEPCAATVAASEPGTPLRTVSSDRLTPVPNRSGTALGRLLARFEALAGGAGGAT